MRSNVWIRKDNEQAWSEISDKSAFVNAAIQSKAQPIERYEPKEAPTHMWGDTPVVVKEIELRNTGKCPHGYNLMTSNCKYGCKK